MTNLNQKFSNKSIIKFKCFCGKENGKIIDVIIRRNLGLFCDKHTKENALNKRKKTNKKLYGVELPLQNEKIKQKLEKTNIEKYGTHCSLLNQEVKEKIENTNLEKYGYKKHLKSQKIREKIENTNLKKYGGKSPAQNDQILQKIQNTNLKKYGVKFLIHNKEIRSKQRKSRHSIKEYTFKTGEIVEVQGFEPYALDILQNQGYTYNDIQIEDIIIEYIYKNKKRKHYPDIYIPKENRIIEVKSTWTYESHINKNLQKQKTSLDNGFNYEFWIFNNKKELVIK